MGQENQIKHMIYVFCENEIVYDIVMYYLREARADVEASGYKLELNWGDIDVAR